MRWVSNGSDGALLLVPLRGTKNALLDVLVLVLEDGRRRRKDEEWVVDGREGTASLRTRRGVPRRVSDVKRTVVEVRGER